MSQTLNTTVDLLRHGETQAGRVFCGSTDVALSETGYEQLQRMGAHLLSLDDNAAYDVVLSSPMQRCAVFARAFAKQQGVACELMEGLRELCFGQWEGLSAAQIMDQDAKRLSQYWSNPASVTPEGGESFADFKERVQTAWMALLQRHQGKRLLVLAHGGTIRSIISQVLQLPHSSLLRLQCPHASVTRIDVYHDQQGEHSCSLAFHGLTVNELSATAMPVAEQRGVSRQC